MALAQIAPIFLDRQRTLEKVEGAVRTAARAGASLVAFGEACVPGYPAWLERTDGARFESDRQKDLYARYVQNAVDIEAGHLDAVCSAARELGIFVVLGIVERSRDRGRSLFCTAASIGADGALLSTHRKLMPTYEERLVWTPGDAHGLEVHTHQEFRVGALNCWENWMPLPRAALHARGETLHVALWPGQVRNTEPITCFLAREGRSFVISVGSVLRASDVPSDFPHRDVFVPNATEVLYNGGSCVAGPNGQWILPPDGSGDEKYLYADLDAREVDRERQSFDPAGHYARPELLEVRVNSRRPTMRRESP